MVPLLCTAQTNCTARAGAGFSAGYSPAKQSAVGEIYAAYKLSDHFIVYPVSFKFHSKVKLPDVPVIIEPRIGYRIYNTEIYGGIGYHAAGQDGKAEYYRYRGFRPGAGIIQHLGRTFILTAAVSGDIYTFTAGVLAFH